MSWLTVISAIVLLLLCLLSTTANLSLRHLHLARLVKELAVHDREYRINAFRQHRDGYILATATLRMACLLGVVLVLDVIIGERFESRSTSHYVTVFILTGLLVSIFGVVVPHAWAKYAGESFLIYTFPGIQLVHVLTRPFVMIYRLFDSLVRRLAGVAKTDGEDELEQIEQDVLDMINEAGIQGAVDETEKAMLESVMELDETTADQIMTPRIDLIAVEHTASLENLKLLIKKEGHSRIPVYEETIDKVLGMVYAKDLLHVDNIDNFKLTDHIRPAPFVPETKSLRDLLQEFKTGKTHAAIVLDEYGGTAGMVTIEDIFEELVGDIVDEYEPPEPEPIQQIDDNTVEVDSKVHVEELNERFGLTIPENDDYETIGGFVFSTLGKIPAAGEQLTVENTRITILSAEDRRVNRLRLERLPQEAKTT